MITFVKKPVTQPSPTEAEANPFEQVRKAAAERHEKADTNVRHHGAPPSTKGNRLV